MTADFSIASDWYQTFFTGPVMRFWEAAVPQAATDSEVAFMLRHMRAQLRPPCWMSPADPDAMRWPWRRRDSQ
jgi:hypothetical protein